MMIGTMGSSSESEAKILELQNFLKFAPLTLFNLVPQKETGVVSFTANLKAYSQLFILAIDMNSVAQRQIDLDEIQPTSKRDLSLTKSLPTAGNKGFTESRTTIELTKGEVHSIEDITSTEI